VDSHTRINDILVHLFREIWELEEKAIITEEFKDISLNDMHIIEAIGLGDGKNMSAIAKLLNITTGSLTTSMNSLVNKKYAIRRRSDEDRRIVYIRLSEKGERAFLHHQQFHEKMTDAVVETMPEVEMQVLLQALGRLDGFFKGYNS
jgi:Transcriptional regulators